tara:strand:+ start:1172 stop:1783 length:612 start_codon:yes stop_codon:yes gene_type:complete
MCFKDIYNYLKTINKKRFTLPFVGIIALLIIDDIRNFTYMPLILSFGSFIIFWNFPILVYESTSKPLYYEDIFIDENKLPNYEIDEVLKNKFKNILLNILIISNSLLFGALGDYWLYKKRDTTTYIEIIGMTGGIIKIFQIINQVIAKIMLSILKHIIERENNNIDDKDTKAILEVIELKQINTDDINNDYNISNKRPRIYSM